MIDYYTRVAPAAAPAPARAAPHAQALPRRGRGPVLLREAVPEPPAGLGAHRRRLERATTAARSTSASPTTCRRSCGWRNLADLELHTSLALAADVEGADDARLRPRPRAAGDDRRVRARSRSACARRSRTSGWRRSRRPRARRGCRSTCRSTAERDLRADQAVRAGARAAARAPPPGARRLRHAQVAARRQGARRLEPERRAQDDRQRLLAAGARAADGLDAADAGRRSRRCSSPRDPDDLVFTADEVLDRVAEHGDLFAPVTSLVQTLPQLSCAVPERRWCHPRVLVPARCQAGVAEGQPRWVRGGLRAWVTVRTGFRAPRARTDGAAHVMRAARPA